MNSFLLGISLAERGSREVCGGQVKGAQAQHEAAQRWLVHGSMSDAKVADMLAEQLANVVRERDELCALVVELEARLLTASGDTTFHAEPGAELQQQLALEMERANTAEAKLCEAESRELKLKEDATPVSEPPENVSLASKILELEKNLQDETRRREAAEAEVAKLQEERAATAAGHAAAIEDWEQKHGRMEGELLVSRQRFLHTAGADAPVHTAVSGTNPGGAQAPQTPHSESRWQNLKNIHTPTKWYKVPDVAVLSAATRRAQEALAAAEEELLRSTERRARYSEPWTPPNLQSFAEGLGKEPEAGENNQNRFR